MKVTQCDLCGKIDNSCLQLTLPIIRNDDIFQGAILSFVPKECDVCWDCQKKISELINRILKNYDRKVIEI